MPPQNSNIVRQAVKLTALIMAQGLVSHAQNPTPSSAPAATSTNSPTHLPEVVVKGQQEPSYKPELSGSSPKYTEPLRDTPQSISVVPREVMNDQGVSTLRDALRNVSGISIAAGEGGAQGDNLTLRGFTARNDIFLDGMRDFGSYYRDPFNYEQVEILKGPSSVMFGRGSTGGVLNQASKTPELQSMVGGSFSLGTDNTRRGTLDYNTPIEELGHGSAFRLNLMGNDSEMAGRDVARNMRFGVAPSIAFGLGTPTRLVVSFLHQSEDDIPDYGLPWVFNRPADVRKENFYGFENHDFLKTAADIGTVKLEHDFSDAFTLHDQFRYANYQRDAQITEPQYQPTVNPLNPINRNQIGVSSTETFLQNQIDLTSKFTTGFIGHTLVTGIEAGRETSDPIRYNITGVPRTTLNSPNENQDYAGVSTRRTQVDTTSTSAGIYAVDTLKLHEKWDLLGGFRYDHFETDYTEAVAHAAFGRTDNLPSWRGGLVFKPLPFGSIYFDYGTSFNPSAETLALSQPSQGLEPESNQTFELGTKWDLLSDRLTLRGAVFRTDKTNARETDPTNANNVVLAGEQRVDGFEFEAAGHITEEWQVFAGYTFLHSEVISSRFFPGAVGARLANVPENTFTLWTTYKLPYGFEIGGGPRYVGSRTASSTVPIEPTTGLVKQAPGYWEADAMIKYNINKNISVQLNVYNLADTFYYDQIHPSHVVPGAGRSALLTTNFRF